MKTTTLFFVLLLCVLPALGADQTSVGGPVSGFVFDQKQHTLRPMLGVPGSAYLGDALMAGLDAAAVAPDGQSALVVQEDVLFLVTGLNAAAAIVPIENAMDGADRLAWSRDGATAAAYSSRSGRAQFLRKLPKTPEAGEPLDLSALPGTVSALAVDGDNLLLGVSAEQGGIYLASAHAAPRLIASAADPAAVALAGRDLYFADRERQQVWQVLNFATDATPLLFAGEALGLSSPVGLQLSGKRLFVANAGSRTLDVFDVDSRASAGRIDLDFTPATLAAFGSQPLWLMNAGDGGEPLYVLEGGREPAVYFVPAGREQ